MNIHLESTFNGAEKDTKIVRKTKNIIFEVIKM